MPRGEISTEAIVTDALQRGKKVFVPYTYKLRFNESERPSVVMDMVSLLSQEDYKSLESDAWGIPTPSKASIINRQKCLGDDEITHDRSPGGSVETDDLDVIIVPGMAFNHGLRRLGHGKGFYDYFLHRYQEMKVAKEGNSSKMPFVGKIHMCSYICIANLTWVIRSWAGPSGTTPQRRPRDPNRPFRLAFRCANSR